MAELQRAERPLPASRVPPFDRTWPPGLGRRQCPGESQRKTVRAWAAHRHLEDPCGDGCHFHLFRPGWALICTYWARSVCQEGKRATRNCMMQKRGARLGEAAAPPGHRLLGAGATHTGTAASLTVSPRRPFASHACRPAWDCPPTTDRELLGDSHLCPLPRQPGVWTRPADPLTHRAASAPPTVWARNVPGAARRGGATWWPDRVSAAAAPEGATCRGAGRVRRPGTWVTVAIFTYTMFYICNMCFKIS